MDISAENLQRHLPYYLSAEDRRVLVDNLRALASGRSAEYFLSPQNNAFQNKMLQGDGWHGFQVFVHGLGRAHQVAGVVLSNSCDVDPESLRETPPRVTFAPFSRLAAYENLLHKSGVDRARVREKISSIRAQKATNMFYLPAGGPLVEDHVIRFDEVQSMPWSMHAGSPHKKKIFTLSDTGFYLFVFKLSVHFCRLQENVIRKSPDDRPRH